MNYPVLALIITNIIWGGAAPIFKYALSNIPPFTLAFIRFFVGALIFFPAAVINWKKITLTDLVTICTAAFFGISINISFYFLGLTKGTSINAPIIASSGPLFLFILAVIFLKEKPKKKVFFGMLLSLVGVIVIVVSPMLLDGRRVVATETMANLFFVIATIGVIVDALIAKRILRKINPFQFVFIAFLFSSMTFLPFMRQELSAWSFAQLNAKGVLGIFYGVIFASTVAYYFFYWGISKLQAQEVGLFTYIDPVAALLIAIPLLGEYPTHYYWIGSFLVFLGIFIAENRLHWHPLYRLKLKAQSPNVKI